MKKTTLKEDTLVLTLPMEPKCLVDPHMGPKWLVDPHMEPDGTSLKI